MIKTEWEEREEKIHEYHITKGDSEKDCPCIYCYHMRDETP